MPCPYIYESQAARRRAQTPGARRSLANVLRGRELSRSSRSGRLRLLDLHVHGNEALNIRDLEAQPFVEHSLLNASELAEDHAALAGADRLNNTGFQFEPGIQPLRWSSASLIANWWLGWKPAMHQKEWCWTWIASRARCMDSRRGVPTTGISNRSVITRCCCSAANGDCLAVKLRPGNMHSAEDWDELLLSEIERQQAAGKQIAFRGDPAFARMGVDLRSARSQLEIPHKRR